MSKSSISTDGTSAHVSGAETVACGRARTLYAEAMVWSRAIRLKSTKTRSPRSSFHHCAVASSGRRRSSSRATATAQCRTSVNVQSGRTRT